LAYKPTTGLGLFIQLRTLLLSIFTLVENIAAFRMYDP